MRYRDYSVNYFVNQPYEEGLQPLVYYGYPDLGNYVLQPPPRTLHLQGGRLPRVVAKEMALGVHYLTTRPDAYVRPAPKFLRIRRIV